MKTPLVHRLVSVAIASFLLALPAAATCGGGGGGGVGGMDTGKAYSVSWQRLHALDEPSKDKMAVYWFPASDLDYDQSTLKTSRTLSLYGSGCVTMYVIDLDSPLKAKYVEGAKVPLVVLVAPDGSVVDKAESVEGALQVEQVEQMLDAEVKKREQELTAKMDTAKTKAESGDTTGAIDDLKAVVEQKCLFPKPAKEAARQLKKLGVTGVSVVPAGPNLDAAVSRRIQALMAAGLQAEIAANYSQAEKLYQEAHLMDPADPAPLRYLGELYRHDSGQWDKAREVFSMILAMSADPISRAVALHGIGKMTIHEGDFKKGLHLMEESVATYPLPMAYRNLAVYWNSEGDKVKADEYAQKALKLAPKDPYNLVFAAVYMAGDGKTEEALKIARDNESLLPASYNLAAIYAQAGQKEKALAFLKRHFYRYERFRAVRAEEMMEARVDAVFASIVKDKDFLALTSLADGMLKMNGSAPRMTAH